jgi:hypothetical protein
MSRRIARLLTGSILIASTALTQTPAAAQSPRLKLHVNPRWDECSFQLDPSLTQAAWHQFTEEAGLVAYFRPLSDARPMDPWNVEVSVLQWQTGINDADAAWNDTFVHPDSTHWLFDGSRLSFPGAMVRAGVTRTMDVSVYLTKNPGANYGFYGAQLQRSFSPRATGNWSAAARVSFVSLHGPADLDFTVYGANLLASRAMTVRRWATVSPYVGVSSYLATSHEKTTAVRLDDERVLGARATLGAALQLSVARLGVEYSVAKVNSLSFKVGIGR